jgi:hypothetical protein
MSKKGIQALILAVVMIFSSVSALAARLTVDERQELREEITAMRAYGETEAAAARYTEASLEDFHRRLDDADNLYARRFLQMTEQDRDNIRDIIKDAYGMLEPRTLPTIHEVKAWGLADSWTDSNDRIQGCNFSWNYVLNSDICFIIDDADLANLGNQFEGLEYTWRSIEVYPDTEYIQLAYVVANYDITTISQDLIYNDQQVVRHGPSASPTFNWVPPNPEYRDRIFLFWAEVNNAGGMVARSSFVVVQVYSEFYFPLTFDINPTSIYINDANITADVTATGTATGTISVSGLPQGVIEYFVDADDNVIRFVGNRPAAGEPPVYETHIVIVSRDGIDRELEININLTPMPEPTRVKAWGFGESWLSEENERIQGCNFSWDWILNSDICFDLDEEDRESLESQFEDLEYRWLSIELHPDIEYDPLALLVANYDILTIDQNLVYNNNPVVRFGRDESSEFNWIPTAYRGRILLFWAEVYSGIDLVARSSFVVVQVHPQFGIDDPTFYIDPTSIEINDSSLSANINVTGTATGAITVNGLPPAVTHSIVGDQIIFTGTRAMGAVNGEFEVTVRRGGIDRTLTLYVDLTDVTTVKAWGLSDSYLVNGVKTLGCNFSWEYALLNADIDFLLDEDDYASLSGYPNLTYQWFSIEVDRYTGFDTLVDIIANDNYITIDESLVIEPKVERNNNWEPPDETYRNRIFLFWAQIYSNDDIVARSTFVAVQVHPNFNFNGEVSEITLEYDGAADFGTINFGTVTEGYPAITPRTVTVTNTGTLPTGTLSITLNGPHSGRFTVEPTTLPSMNAGDVASFTVVPNHNLPDGTYIATVTVSNGDEINETFIVRIVVEEEEVYAIELDPADDIDFGEAPEGYPQIPARNIEITNTGNQPTGVLTITSSSPHFIVTPSTISNIDVDDSNSFTVVPANNLLVGVYNATITVSGAHGIIESFDVVFEVIEGNGDDDVIFIFYELYTFDALPEGYSAAALTPHEVIVFNVNQTEPTRELTVTVNNPAFTVTPATIPSIAFAESAIVTIVPNVGLAAGTYDAIITVTTVGGLYQTTRVRFVVTDDYVCKDDLEAAIYRAEGIDQVGEDIPDLWWGRIQDALNIAKDVFAYSVCQTEVDEATAELLYIIELTELYMWTPWFAGWEASPWTDTQPFGNHPLWPVLAALIDDAVELLELTADYSYGGNTTFTAAYIRELIEAMVDALDNLF